MGKGVERALQGEPPSANVVGICSTRWRDEKRFLCRCEKERVAESK